MIELSSAVPVAEWRRPGSRALVALCLCLSAFAQPALAQSGKSLEKLTGDLVSLSIAYQSAADPDLRARRADRIAEVAGERKGKLKNLLDRDPDAVLKLAVPGNRRAALPASLQALVERDRNVEGDLDVLYEDNAR